MIHAYDPSVMCVSDPSDMSQRRAIGVRAISTDAGLRVGQSVLLRCCMHLLRCYSSNQVSLLTDDPIDGFAVQTTWWTLGAIELLAINEQRSYGLAAPTRRELRRVRSRLVTRARRR